ncbi:MAG: ScyD/ScyE family protein [Thermoleophilia bacterium]
MPTPARLATAGSVALLAAIPAALALSAPAPTVSTPIATGLAQPLQLAVHHGDVLIAQGSGTLTRIGADGTRTNIRIPNLDGLDARGGGAVVTTRAGNQETVTGSVLWRVKADGTRRRVADLLAYEKRTNPDKVNTYGFTSIPADCAAKVPKADGPATYTGQIDSNPFAVLVRGSRTFVADAGANAILAVSGTGRVRTVAVLPPQPTVITKAGAKALKLPACAVGLTYNFEPVPTDVEAGPGNTLYVTTLPGGPEGPELGARGAVHRVNAVTGAVHTVGRGFLGATGVAVGPRGRVYVAELFANRISTPGAHGPVTVAKVSSPSGLEYASGRLYVTYDVFRNGSLATVGPIAR